LNSNALPSGKNRRLREKEERRRRRKAKREGKPTPLF